MTTAGDKPRQPLESLGKSPVDVTNDYIRAICQHALGVIETKYSKAYIDTIEKEYVLSVPGIWSEKAQNNTLMAATNAGIYPVRLVKELETAALYTIHSQKSIGLVAGDVIIDCDCDGGTADLISYETFNINPLELKELVPCTGDLYGSIMHNHAFEDWLLHQLGDTSISQIKGTTDYPRGMKLFEETIKRTFVSEQDEGQYISFPSATLGNSSSTRIKRNLFEITGADLKSILTPIVSGVCQLVFEQPSSVILCRQLQSTSESTIGSKIKAVFLVGDFGTSTVLLS
ncbi:hypothetical protein P152DRAFT_449898 [Eremomyces bilateralis CBS 781.70]|uniref:Actin-like ATPase domain-containing protein n=1 Tax=Eremomyces bilateralis CBS 781.70 TaxID=1392243 RepID=A0A6G1G2H1_9PEZI|nr:uncharacterized protein P152DRAFT_449898 [Eremomyces bilateralis CBS 781.70]KAF1812121.1 hypothetical protein P152DRAFT_449898 [Eremomyces bilateralis CBS 781.70]